MGDKVNKKLKTRFNPDKLPRVGYGFSVDTVASFIFTLQPSTPPSSPASALRTKAGRRRKARTLRVKYMRLNT